MSAVPKDYTAVPGAGPGAITLVEPGAMPNAPVVAAPQAVVVAEPTPLLATIMQIASRPEVNVENIERLIALQERAEARQAERAFYAELNAVQGEIDHVCADAQNPQTRSKYATYFALDQALRPHYIPRGFSISWDTEEAPANFLLVVGYLAHRGGHKQRYTMSVPADGKGAKGGDVMSPTHATGSAFSYGKRYLEAGMFNIPIDKDDDGNGAGINDAQVTAIFKLIKDTGTDEKVFCDYFRIPMVADLSRKDYQRAADYLRRKSGVPQITPEYLK